MRISGFLFQTTGQLPIHLAAAGGHIELVELLSEAGTPMIDEDKDGMNPMHLAAKNGHRSIVDFLKSKLPLSSVSIKVIHCCALVSNTETFVLFRTYYL